MSVALERPRLRPLRVRMLLAWLLAWGLGAGAVALAHVASRLVPRRMPLEELAYYPSGHALQPASLGHAESVADLAWLRAVQYYGEHRTTDLRFVQLERVFDVLTSLSPHFESPYAFGAFALAQEGRDFAAAERLMHRGIEANPRSGWLAFELGFLYYVHPGGRELAKAAACFERASRLPGGPPSAKRFAAYASQHSGDLVVALMLWQQVRATSDNRLLREMAETEIAKLQEALRTGRKGAAMHALSTPNVLIKSMP